MHQNVHYGWAHDPPDRIQRATRYHGVLIY